MKSLITRSATYCVKSVVDDMFQILTHSDLSHQLVLVSVHSRELTNVSKCVLQSISQLESIHVSQSVLNMGVYNQLCETENLTTQVKGISKSRFLSLL